MNEPLLNPVRSAPDERYCDWISIGDDGQSVRCKNKPMVVNVEFQNWKLCFEHKAEFDDGSGWELIQK